MRATVLIVALLLAAAVAVSVSSSESRTPLYEWVRVPRQWQLIGRAPAQLRHSFTVALHANNRNVLEQRFWEIATPGHPQYRKFMTTEEVQALVDPGVHVRQPVVDWLRSESGVQVTEHADFIKVEAPIRAIERLFDTKMVLYKHARTGKSIVRHTGATSVPTHVRPSIHLIEGLHEFPRVRNMKASAAGPQTPDAAFPFVSYNFAPTLWKLYNITGNTVTSPKATQGVFAQQAADGIPLLTDLATYDSLNGIPKQTYTYNGVNDTQIGTEASLDMQMITSIAMNAPTTFFMQQAWMYTFTTDLIAMGTSAPLVISVSYGWAEAQECSDVLHDLGVCKSHGWNAVEYINATDAQFMKFGSTGHTFVVCTQDEGAPGETNDGCQLDSQLALYPEYPATSPYVLAVGATAIAGSGNGIGALLPENPIRASVAAAAAAAAPSLSPPCTAYNCSKAGTVDNVPCYLQNAIFTTGGGFSQVNAQPSFQKAAVAHYMSSVTMPPSTKFNKTNRAYPDVGAIGQNVVIVMNGQYVVTGGTSASTPIFAGVMTLLNNYLLNAGKAQLGFANVLLYNMAIAQPNTFNHVTSGANKCTEQSCCLYGYLTNPDGTWSPVTGLGSPNVGNMIAYLKANNI